MLGIRAWTAAAVFALFFALPSLAGNVSIGGLPEADVPAAFARENQEVPPLTIEDAVEMQILREGGALSEEKACLTEAIYFESKGEPLNGQIAVAHVILNRAASGKYPASICGVVNQKGQFTYSRRRNMRPVDDPVWKRSRAVAELAIQGLFVDVAERALFFHSVRVAPSWRKAMRRVGTIGAHVFYAAGK